MEDLKLNEHEIALGIERGLESLKNVATFPTKESKAESDADTMAEFMRRRAETHERNIVERKKAIKSKIYNIDAQIALLYTQKHQIISDERRDNASDEKIANACRTALKIIEEGQQ